MSERLTKKEKGFANDFLDTGNGVQSALNNYDTESYSTAGVIAHENLKKPKIQAYLLDKAEVAVGIVFEIATAGENDNVKLSAAKDILDRAGFKPTEKSVNTSLNLNLNVNSDLENLIAETTAEKLKDLKT